MSDPERGPISSDSDDESVKRLLPVVYAELRALAAHYLDGRSQHTLQPTALVHEAYLKLAKSDMAWCGRDHFVATAARAMRQILVDHARKKHAEKRGGSALRVTVDLEAIPQASTAERDCAVVDLDHLLVRLESADSRAARIAEWTLFGGMGQDEIANVLGVSRMTVTRDWQFARAWLASELKAPRPADAVPPTSS
ncbi:MAG: sigma-70 family RNA polymerase sigma factor [Phycisphaerae bacterium]|jgi:RNA polymerase sigma-70 factor (ECF subfamily)|nr:sigma-70 family RNA polymerase sigma factor [Phycisphaerae bacterium]